MQWAIDTATLHGATYRAIGLTMQLHGGHLRMDPIEATAPGGPIHGQFMADATATPPTAALVLRAPALDAAPIAAAVGQGGALTGTIDLDLQLHAAGATWSAMANTLSGHAGVSLVDGEVANDTLAALFGPALQAAKLPVEAAGRSHVRCFAVRADAAGGQVTIPTLALDATRLRLEGNGTIDIPGQTLDLHLRPTLRLGGTAVAIPVHLTGPWRTPHPAIERGAISLGRLGISIGGPAHDPCGPALAAVRAMP